MLFSFKQKSQDFIVEETIPFKLRGKGDAFFVYFEKRNLTTMEVIDYLCKKLKISRMTLGFAGLKDKDAITRQWVSIYKSALQKMWWEKVFLEALSEITRIIQTNRHDKPIGMTSEIKNTFYIRLRALKNLSQIEKQKTEETMSNLFEEGFPNVFGNQRFGIEGRNRRQWKQLIDGELKMKEKFDVKFKLQAYASWLFNEYVMSRIKTKWELIDGEIVEVDSEDSKSLAYYDAQKNVLQLFDNKNFGKNFFSYPSNLGKTITYTPDTKLYITGPILGFDLLMPSISSKAGKIEKELFDKNWLSENNLKLFKDNKIFWLRRKIWTWPQKAKFNFEWDDLLIEFTLDSGVYASVLIDKLLSSFD